MRARNQEGQITRKGPNWVLRIYEDRVVDGKVQRVRTPKIICTYAEHPLRGTASDIEFLRKKYADKISQWLTPVNKEHAIVSGTITLGQFIEQSYWPRCEWRVSVPAANELHMESSTVDCYRDIYRLHVKDAPIAKVKIQDFTPTVARKYIEALDQNLSHESHKRIKAFLSGVMAWAINEEAYRGANPMAEIKVGGRKKGQKMDMSDLSESERIRLTKIARSHEHAYTLEEVATMLGKLPEPARTVCAVAAFTGLSRSELRGLKWSDYVDGEIRVQRKVIDGTVGATKTTAREDAVPVVPWLQKILKKYKEEFPETEQGWVFRGKQGGPLSLDNLSRKDIPIFINGAWYGWHAFRRGLGSRLDEAGLTDKTIQSVLRHANVSTTMAFYVKPDREAAKAGLKKLTEVMQRKYKIKA
jgi:integrase